MPNLPPLHRRLKPLHNIWDMPFLNTSTHELEIANIENALLTDALSVTSLTFTVDRVIPG